MLQTNQHWGVTDETNVHESITQTVKGWRRHSHNGLYRMGTCIHTCCRFWIQITHAFKICCIEDKKWHRNNTHTHTHLWIPDVHQHSDSHTHFLQNNHLRPLVHHYGSLHYTHSLCCCDAVTLDKGSCRSGETTPSQVNDYYCCIWTCPARLVNNTFKAGVWIGDQWLH